ncbi:serine protease [Novosphingobium sp. FSW06-99]|uniref:S1 family peptidase n=1 Tax=Novosphingobium sp. FSW06-99 TaxID=1739113 RepID=UPI00076D44F6|nr:serine protease [Novosphingobium sp. FSW06-99]KUR74354.1 peptidase S1 [Novosphingobium sp. FSW06-99]
MLLRRLVRPLLLVLPLLALIGGARPALADPGDIAAASRGVVRVVLVRSGFLGTSMLGHGSGFAVAPDMIVTNAHVVQDAHGDGNVVIGVIPSQGSASYPAHIVAYSPANDLALLQLGNHAALQPLTLFPGAVSDGMQIAAVGYPGNVDAAQGLNAGDLVTPQDTVKTYGQVSSGRSSRQFDTILHTAQLGAGNSGGPLLDTCGRVLGVNSFGTVSDNGTDSSFFFAISMRELQPFLKSAGVIPHLASLPCTSIADLDRADSQRSADDQARVAAEALARTAAREHAFDKARHDAELDVLSERDNGLALAALLLVAAIGAATFAFLQRQRGQVRGTRIGVGLLIVLVLGAGFAWILRPSLSAIDDRAKDRMAEVDASGTPAPDGDGSTAAAAAPQKLICVLDPQRSRVTVSDITDVPLQWSAGGCVNGKTQYGLAQDGWSRVLVPNGEDTIAVTHFDPAAHSYTVERFLMGIDDMNRARAERSKIAFPPCGASEDLARQLGSAQAAIKTLLPAEPNERMRYTCQPAR